MAANVGNEPTRDPNVKPALNLRVEHSLISKHRYELKNDTAMVAVVQFDGINGIKASGRTLNGEWQFQRDNMLTESFVVISTRENRVRASFQAHWRGGGILTLTEGKVYSWSNTGRTHTDKKWAAQDGMEILSYRHTDLKGIVVTISPEGMSLPELELLMLTGMYVIALVESEGKKPKR